MVADVAGQRDRRASRFRFRESPTFILLTVSVAIFNVSYLVPGRNMLIQELCY